MGIKMKKNALTLAETSQPQREFWQKSTAATEPSTRIEHSKRVLWLLTALCEAFDKTLTEQLHRIYVIALENIEEQALEQCLPSLLKSRKWMPKPSEIREACGAQTSIDRPTLSWQAVRQAITTIGAYDSVDFDDPTINACLRSMGGWEQVTEWASDDIHWRERDFLRNYAALLGVSLRSEQTAPLAGIYELENGPSIPSRTWRVGCLSVGTQGRYLTHRITSDPKRIEAQHSPAVANLVRNLPLTNEEMVTSISSSTTR